jgi:small conductance mechanosensitive channel
MVQALPIFDSLLPAQYALAITQVLYFVVTFIVVVLLGRLFVSPVIGRMMKRRNLDEHAKRPLRRLTRAIIYFVAIAAAFGIAGFSSFLQSLATIAAAGTLAIGFALQDVIKNFVAGVFIYTDRPFKIGDWIEWDDRSGIVEDISLRVTRVRTFDNELLTVPNSVLTGASSKTPSRSTNSASSSCSVSATTMTSMPRPTSSWRRPKHTRIFSTTQVFRSA